jgi:hypothetical protein
MLHVIQRPRRKKHLATLLGDRWETVGSCRLSVPVDGTDHVTVDGAASVGTDREQDVDVCLHCLHLIGFARYLQANPDVFGGVPARHLTAVAS